MIELIERAELFRLRAAENLQDQDPDRSFCCAFRLHAVSLITRSGPPLDPYTALDLSYALENAAARLPEADMTGPRAALVGNVFIMSCANKIKTLQVNLQYARAGMEGKVETRELDCEDYGMAVEKIGRVIPRHRIAETRTIRVRVWRIAR
jgi:hypothetical protein